MGLRPERLRHRPHRADVSGLDVDHLPGVMPCSTARLASLVLSIRRGLHLVVIFSRSINFSIMCTPCVIELD